jgi:hypothetical protein
MFSSAPITGFPAVGSDRSTPKRISMSLRVVLLTHDISGATKMEATH